MSTWLYQLSQDSQWPPERFRFEIREQQSWHWTHGVKRGAESPMLGDTIVFFCSRTGGTGFGIYGWAVVDDYNPDWKTIYFTPVAPTDHLKMDP
jgi:hypothetical protein